MSDLRQMMITKYDAIMAVKKYLDDEDRLQGKEPNERHNRWRAEVILEGTALTDTPQTDCSGKPNNCTDCECTDDCSKCKEAEHGCKDESQAECEITDCDYHDACKKRGQTDCPWK